MRNAVLLVVALLLATGACRHATYGGTQGPVVPTDTLNGEPRSHAPANVPDQPVRGEPNAPPPPP